MSINIMDWWSVPTAIVCVCVCVYMFAHMRYQHLTCCGVCVHVCVCMCMHVCVCVYVCVCVCVCVDVKPNWTKDFNWVGFNFDCYNAHSCPDAFGVFCWKHVLINMMLLGCGNYMM